MAALYDIELNGLLSQLLRARHFTPRRQPSDPWFDKECCDAMQLTCRLEHAYAADCLIDNVGLAHFHRI